MEEEKTFDQEIPVKKFPLLRNLLQIVLYLGGILLVSFLLVTYVIQRTVVSGDSMNNYLHDGDNILVEKLSYRFGDVERFDIVVFEVPYEPKGTYYIKRVIGLPGETVQIVDSQIYINGQVLEENYGKDRIREGGIASQPITLGPDEYFVMGDNRNNSTDSRSQRLGPVKKGTFIGKAWVRIFPFSGFGVLRHQ
ncbi:MAG: signal peptidase I [Lachnospiraceae bacterium]|nr:signal peptidase I [Lachnospiraceae bacterium]